jgi:hypothetical protein
MSRNPIPEKAAIAPPSLPSFIPSVIATAILSLALGYWVGVGNSFLWGGSSKRSRHRKRKPYQASDDGRSTSSDVSSGDETDLSGHQILGLANEECKMVIIVMTLLMLGVSR